MPRYVLQYRDTTFRLPEGATLVIGRGPNADIQVGDRGASRRHARLVIEPNGVWLEDLASRNGVHLATGKLDRRVFLERETVFRIGQSRFTLRIARADEQIEDTSVTEYEPRNPSHQADHAHAALGAPGQVTVDEPLDPVMSRVELGRRVLADDERSVPERFGSVMTLVQELVEAGAEANARLVFGAALDLLIQKRVTNALPPSTVARAHAYVGRWAKQIENSPGWAARRRALRSAERLPGA